VTVQVSGEAYYTDALKPRKDYFYLITERGDHACVCRVFTGHMRGICPLFTALKTPSTSPKKPRAEPSAQCKEVVFLLAQAHEKVLPV
jgi:hypothetical protein